MLEEVERVLVLEFLLWRIRRQGLTQSDAWGWGGWTRAVRGDAAGLEQVRRAWQVRGGGNAIHPDETQAKRREG